MVNIIKEFICQITYCIDSFVCSRATYFIRIYLSNALHQNDVRFNLLLTGRRRGHSQKRMKYVTWILNLEVSKRNFTCTAMKQSESEQLKFAITDHAVQLCHVTNWHDA